MANVKQTALNVVKNKTVQKAFGALVLAILAALGVTYGSSIPAPAPAPAVAQ